MFLVADFLYHCLSLPFFFFLLSLFFFFFNDTATTEIYTLSLHDALPISSRHRCRLATSAWGWPRNPASSFAARSEEHTSELQSLRHLVCRLLLEKKKKKQKTITRRTKVTPDR